jgi:hypothetical protein
VSIPHLESTASLLEEQILEAAQSEPPSAHPFLRSVADLARRRFLVVALLREAEEAVRAMKTTEQDVVDYYPRYIEQTAVPPAPYEKPSNFRARTPKFRAKVAHLYLHAFANWRLKKIDGLERTSADAEGLGGRDVAWVLNYADENVKLALDLIATSADAPVQADGVRAAEFRRHVRNPFRGKG